MSESLTTAAEGVLGRGTDTDGSALAKRVGDALEAATTSAERDAVLDEMLELRDASVFMKAAGVSRIALQFPDGLLCHASRSVERLQALMLNVVEASADVSLVPCVSKPVDVVVLGDTSFGSDMVDEVAAKHYDPSDALANSRGLSTDASAGHSGAKAAVGVVHFGSATLSASTSLPVYYALGKAPFDLDFVSRSIKAALLELVPALASAHTEAAAGEVSPKRTLWLSADSDLLHALPAVKDSLAALLPPTTAIVVPPTTVSFTPEPRTEAAAAADASAASPAASGGSVGAVPPMDAAAYAAEQLGSEALAGSPTGEGAVDAGGIAIAHVGSGGESLRRLCLVLGGVPTATVPPAASGSADGDCVEWGAHGGTDSRALTRHFLHAQRARLAHSVALVAGTMAARGFLPLLRGLRRLIRQSGRRCTTLLVGKLNPAKLANFEGVDVFVVLGAGDAALLPASSQRDFAHPVLAVHELLMGLLPEKVPWQGRLVSDVSSLLELLGRVAPECLADGTDATGGREEDSAAPPAAASGSDSDAPYFSPLTGQFHDSLAHAHDGAAPGGGGAMHVEGEAGSLVPAAETALLVPGTAASVLAAKQWRGMEADVPADAPTEVQRGWHGTARRFDHEPRLGDGPADA